MSNCRSGCATQDHGSWGACARAANLTTMVGDTVQINQQGERDLAAYREARRQGMQPQAIGRKFTEATKKAVGA